MEEALYVSKPFTEPGGFTKGIEGPAVDRGGNVYAVNYSRQQTIGKVTPDGRAEVFLELPGSSTGNGIRFDVEGTMYIADYVGHNIFKTERGGKGLSVHAHEPAMNQPNDLAITRDGVLFASDPNWREGTGQLWRIGRDGKAVRLEAGMGTTNGIEVNPDERTLYVNESRQGNVWAYDLAADGNVSNKRLLIRFDDYGMDGMRCDVAGNVYITRHAKGVVAMVSPEGRLLREIGLAGKNCTNLTFGGEDGRTCYVTVADVGNIEVFRTELPGRCWTLLHGGVR